MVFKYLMKSSHVSHNLEDNHESTVYSFGCFSIIVDMIKVVNIEAVAPDEVLSNSLYKWSKKKGVEVVR